MKIIKPYGYTRLNGERVQEFFPDTKARTDLQSHLDANIGAVVAVWVSTIDKIFGKPDRVTCPERKKGETDEKYQNACAAHERQIRLYKLRGEVLAEAKKNISCQFPADQTNLTLLWDHKLALSTSNDKKEGVWVCKGGKLKMFFAWEQNLPLPTHESIIKQQGLCQRAMWERLLKMSATDLSDKIGAYVTNLTSSRAASVNANQPNKKQMATPIQQAQTQNAGQAEQGFYDSVWKNYNRPADVIACIYAAAKETCAAPKKPTSSLARSKIIAIVGQQLRAHSRAQFPDCENFKEIKERYPDTFALHEAIKRTYKKLLGQRSERTDRPKPGASFTASLKLYHLPENWEAMRKKMGQVEGNQDINALIRQGKVLHYQWMHYLPPDGTLNFQTLCTIDLNASPFWGSLGQFKIKNDEAFLRSWRQALTFANWSFANWCDPTMQRFKGGDSDIFSTKAFEEALKDQGQFEVQARLIFGSQSKLMEWLEIKGNASQDAHQAHQKALLTSTWKMLTQLRNQAFHFNGLPLFIHEANALDTQAQNASADDSSVTTAIVELYQHDLENAQKNINCILESLNVRECFDQASWQTLLPLLRVSIDGLASLPQPRFSRLWQRANHLQVHRQDSDTTPSFFPVYPTREQLESEHEPWHQCRYSILKLIYEHHFYAWFQQKNTQSVREIQTWLRQIELSTTRRAQAINQGDDIRSKASKILAQYGEEEKISLPEFMAKLISETQQLSGSHQEKQAQQQQAKQLENFKLDLFVRAFEKYASNQKHVAATDLLKADESPVKRLSNSPMTLEEWERVNAAQEKDQTPATLPVADNEENQQSARLYFLLHLMPSDAVSLLRHQLQKWAVLQSKWQAEVARLPQSGFSAAPDQQNPQAALVERASRVMALYLLTHQAKYARKQRAEETLPDWVANLYEGEKTDSDKLFTQGQEKVHIPRRHLREMSRFGYAQIAQKLPQKPIASELVSQWLNRDAEALAQAHKTQRDLHQQWVDQEDKMARNFFTAKISNDYQQALSLIEKHKHQQSTVLLIDEYKRYQLIMKVLARLVDYAGLWERDAIFLLTACIHEAYKDDVTQLTPECQAAWSEWLQNGEWNKIWRGGETAAGKQSFSLKGLSNASPTFLALQTALPKLLTHTNGKSCKGIRNNFSHFKMLAQKPNDSTTLQLLTEMENARELMKYDRKLKNAVTYSIVDLFRREGLELQLEFTEEHSLRLKDIKASRIEHLKMSHIQEAQHSEHYVALLRTLLSP